jgi:hypothetical protein
MCILFLYTIKLPSFDVEAAWLLGPIALEAENRQTAAAKRSARQADPEYMQIVCTLVQSRGTGDVETWFASMYVSAARLRAAAHLLSALRPVRPASSHSIEADTILPPSPRSLKTPTRRYNVKQTCCATSGPRDTADIISRVQDNNTNSYYVRASTYPSTTTIRVYTREIPFPLANGSGVARQAGDSPLEFAIIQESSHTF